MIYIFTFSTMIYDYVNREKLYEIVKQAIFDNIEDKELLFLAGQSFGIAKGFNDEMVIEHMQYLLDSLNIKYDIEKENTPEGNGNDLYIYSQETLDDMFANDRERLEEVDRWANNGY